MLSLYDLDVLNRETEIAHSNIFASNENHEEQPLHRIGCGRSVLAIAVSERYVYAGTQGGDVMVSES
jgi:hypothetical protein